MIHVAEKYRLTSVVCVVSAHPARQRTDERFSGGDPRRATGYLVSHPATSGDTASSQGGVNRRMPLWCRSISRGELAVPQPM